MDHRVRLIAAGAVMLLGLGLAMCFRRGATETAMTIPAQTDSLGPHKPADLRSVAANPLVPAQPRPVSSAPRQSQANVTPSDEPAPPPEFARSYPFPRRNQDADQPAGTRWGPSMPDTRPEEISVPPTHKIVDGDTLASLAQRYLGSESRAMEIYQANRDVLADPNILAINTVLKIPRAEQQTVARP